jgi:hypothetical protein
MLHVLLVILKVAGIVLLSILLVLLLLLLFVLFVPIRYSGYAKKNSEVYARATISWLFHIIHFNFYYDRDGAKQVLRIFGIPIDKVKVFLSKFKSIFQFEKTKNKKSKKVRTKSDKTKKSTVNVKNKELNQLDVSLDNKPSEPTKDIKIKDEEFEYTKNDSYNYEENFERKKEHTEITQNVRKKKKKFGIKKWFIHIKNKLMNFIQKLKNLIRNFISFCKNAKDKVEEIKSIIQDERNQEAFRLCKEQLFVVLKHVRPKKYKINVKFGTSDPALTGQILGILGMLMPLYKNNAVFIPDFENAILEGDIYLKGRVTLARVLWIAWKLYRDKNVKRCYKMIMD